MEQKEKYNREYEPVKDQIIGTNVGANFPRWSTARSQEYERQQTASLEHGSH
jgi:hypothetical protein